MSGGVCERSNGRAHTDSGVGALNLAEGELAPSLPLRWRWLLASLVSIGLHAALIVWLLAINWQQPAGTDHILEVQLVQQQTPPPPVEPEPPDVEPPIPVEPDEPESPVEPTEVPAPQPDRAPAPAQPTVVLSPTPVPPTVTSTDILAQLDKYNWDEDRPLITLETEPAEPLALGHINQQDLLEMLDKPLPRLPFADPDTPFVFYSTGFKGEIEKLIDKITRRSSHTTRWGTKVECVYTLIGVFCGFG